MVCQQKTGMGFTCSLIFLVFRHGWGEEFDSSNLA